MVGINEYTTVEEWPLQGHVQSGFDSRTSVQALKPPLFHGGSKTHLGEIKKGIGEITETRSKKSCDI
jgi:hypothetical protein